MLRRVRAMQVMKRVLRVNFEDWEYEIEGLMNVAWTRQPGWAADLWYRSRQTGNLASNHQTFLRACRSATSAYKIDLWVDEEGLVLSARRAGKDVRVTLLKRGQWETRYFGLPSPKSE